jgi:hypothetical protein
MEETIGENLVARSLYTTLQCYGASIHRGTVHTESQDDSEFNVNILLDLVTHGHLMLFGFVTSGHKPWSPPATYSIDQRNNVNADTTK